jgi:hypothetical protein
VQELSLQWSSGRFFNNLQSVAAASNSKRKYLEFYEKILENFRRISEIGFFLKSYNTKHYLDFSIRIKSLALPLLS